MRMALWNRMLETARLFIYLKLKIKFQSAMFLQQDDEFLQERDALEMEVREPEARIELVSRAQCFPFKPSSKIEDRIALFPYPV